MRATHENRIYRLALAAGLPAVLVSLALLWGGEHSAKVRWTLAVIIVGAWLGVALALREQVARPLQTLSNLLAAVREGDFSIRARGARRDDSLGEALRELNALGGTLREQRLGALEASSLLRTVMTEIDVAIFTFDAGQRLRLVNRAGERLLAQPVERLLGRSAADLDLAHCLEGEPVRALHGPFPGGAGRWGMRRGTIREGGLPLHLLVISDLSRELREEERQAWRRLIRVLGHELNNSLAPIKSMAGSLGDILEREPRPADWEEDMGRGLRVIGSRADALSRFLAAYAWLARLPPPSFKPVEVGALVRRAAGLETRRRVTLLPGPELTLRGDSDQLEQALINLIRNAADAALETDGAVRAGWTRNGSRLEVWVEDEGPGLPDSANLFVPFFTTKPGGSGIGLVLSRQIAEAHGGALTLEGRPGGRGCRARLTLPLRGAAPGEVAAPGAADIDSGRKMP